MQSSAAVATPLTPTSMIAREAPYGNAFSAPYDVRLHASRLVYYELPDGAVVPLNGNDPASGVLVAPPGGDPNQNGTRSHENVEVYLQQVSDLSRPLKLSNGNISDEEETRVIAEFYTVLRFVDAQKLKDLRDELIDYDPYATGIIDAQTTLRCLQTYFKQLAIDAETTHLLMKLFARNAQKPRQIYYERMLDYLVAIHGYQNRSLEKAITSLKQCPKENQRTGSQSHEKGDANLIAAVFASLKSRDVHIGIDSIEKLRQSFNISDRLHTGTLERAQIESVLSSFGLLAALNEVFSALLQRAARSGENCYDWSTVVHFIEKALPSTTAQTPNAQYRRDMSSSVELSPVRSQHLPSAATNGNASKPPTYLALPAKNGTPTGGQNGRSSPSSPYSPPAATSSPVRPNEQRPSPQTAPPQHSEENKRLLQSMEEQMLALQLQRDQLRQKLEFETQSVSGKMPLLIEALVRVDQNKTGWIQVNRARQVVVSCGELCGLRFDRSALESAILLSSDPSERLVSISLLSKYLPNAVTK